MKIRYGSRHLVLTLSGFLVAMCTLDPKILQDVGLDLWNDDADEVQMLEEKARAAKVNNTSETTLHRLSLKEEMIADLLEGRIALDVTVKQFMMLNRNGSDLSERVQSAFPGKTLEESTRAHVMAFVNSRIKVYPPEKQEQILARLRQELKELTDAEASQNPTKPNPQTSKNFQTK